MSYRVIDLFAGGGGLSLGFSQAGFDIVCAIENWQPAIDIYQENFNSHPVINTDLGDIDNAAKIITNYAPNIIVGGPPCQDFSSAGKRDESLGRANLTVSFAEIIRKCKPEIFVMENVDRAAKAKAFQAALKIFKSAGYGLTIKTINAAYCGTPQLRKRLIVIGRLEEKDGFMEQLLDAGLANEPMTIRQYFNGSLNFEHYYRHPRSYARRAIFSIDEPSPTIRGVNRPIPKGYPGHSGDPITVNSNLRSLTTLERARIQTFPDSFKWIGSKTDIEQVIGNAVPVKLAEHIASCLIKYLENQDTKNFQNQLFQNQANYSIEQRD